MRIMRIIIILIMMSGLAYADEKAEKSDSDIRLRNMAEELVNLRSKVESLSTKVDIEKAEMQQHLKSLVMQKRDLEANIKRTEVKLAELNKKIDTNKSEISEKEQQRDKLKDVVQKQIESVDTYVEKSLPFKQDKRKREITEFKTKLETGTMMPEKVLARLWSMLEDEFRLTRDSGLYNQNIVLNGKDCLAKVARLGMVLLYFKTIDDKKVGCAVNKDGKWEYRIIKKEEEARTIRYLFDCLEKHIHEGYFKLLNPYSF